MPKKAAQPADGTPSDDTGTLSYEDAVDRLETIIERIESGEIGIEESIDLYEQGTRLLRRCRQILDQAEQRIEKLGEHADRGDPPDGAEGQDKTA